MVKLQGVESAGATAQLRLIKQWSLTMDWTGSALSRGFWCPKTFLLGSDSTAFRFLQLIDQDSQVAPFHEQLDRKTWGAVTPCLFDQGLRVFHGDKLLDFTVYLNSGGEWEYDFHHFGQEKEILLMSLGMGFKERIGKISFMGSWGTIATERLPDFLSWCLIWCNWIPGVHFRILKSAHCPLTLFRCPFGFVNYKTSQAVGMLILHNPPWLLS